MATTTPFDLVQAARRRARLRRRHRHPLRRAGRRLRRHHRRRRSCGAGQARGGAELGGRPRRRPGRELGLLRQLLRRAAAVRRRPPGRGEPRPPAARSSPRCGAGRSSSPRRARRRARRSRASSRSRSCQAVRPPAAVPVGPLRHRRASSTSRRPGPAILVGNHRSYFDPLAMGYVAAPGRAGRCASSARRRCSTRRSSASSPRRWAASGSSGAPGRTSRSPRRPRRSTAGELVALMPQGTIPRGRAFFDPVLKGRWGAARLAAHDEAPGHPGRAVGHRAGVAPQRPAAEPAGRRAPADRPHPRSAGRSS